MTPFGRRAICGGQLTIEVDPHRAGDVTGLERGPAVAAVEVPAHVGQHGLGMGSDEVGVDEGWDHWMSRSARADASANTSRSGRPSAAAAAAASSYSILTRPSATLARTT